MELMNLRRGLMAQMAGNKFVGIKQSSVLIENSVATITFPVESKPWGLLIACGSEDLDGRTGTKVCRVSAIWTEYGGGQYVGGRFAVNRNGSPDHYALQNSAFSYDTINDTFSVTVSAGDFFSGNTYHMWYFTMPF